MGGEKEDNIIYWLTPVRSDGLQTADDVIRTLVGQESIFAFGDRGTVKSSLKPGDWVCFYASTKGVVAHARVISIPERQLHPLLDYTRYPWVVKLGQPSLYTSNPVVINTSLRSDLDTFRHRPSDGRWSWFVQRTLRISKHDFRILTREESV
jgi:hypothetical protein